MSRADSPHLVATAQATARAYSLPGPLAYGRDTVGFVAAVLAGTQPPLSPSAWTAEEIVSAMESVEGYTVSKTKRNTSVPHLLQGGNRMGMGMSRAVEEMLVSAPSEKYIELFPMWPRGFDASFHNLRVKGAFLVSANWSAHGAGTVTFLEIEPAAIDAAQVKECAVMSPWQHVAQVTVHCAGGEAQPMPVANETGVFIFRAENHQKCSISPDLISVKTDDNDGVRPSDTRRQTTSWSGPRATVRRKNGHVELLIDGEPSVPIWFKNHASGSNSSEFWSTVRYELQLAAGAGVPVISFVLACTETASCATDGKLDPTVAKMVGEIDMAFAAANSSRKALLWPTVYPHWPDAESVLTSDSTSSKLSKEYGNSPSIGWRNNTAAAVAQWMQALDNAYPKRVLGVHLAGLQTTEWFYEGMWGAKEGNYMADYSASAQAEWCARNGSRAVIISPASSAPKLGNKVDYPNLARTVGTDLHRARAFAKLCEAFGWDRVALLHDDSVWGRGGAAAMKASVEAVGYSVHTTVDFALAAFDDGTVHARELLDRLDAASPRVIVLVTQLRVQLALYAWAYDHQILYGPGFGYFTFWPGEDSLHNQDGSVNMSAVQGAKGVLGLRPSALRGAPAVVEPIVNLWRSKSSSSCAGLAYCDSDGCPGSWTEYSPPTVDAVLLYAHAMDALYRTAPLSIEDPDALYAAMLQLPAFEGVSGPIKLGDDGDLLARFTLVNLQMFTGAESPCERRRQLASSISLPETRVAFVEVGEYDSLTRRLTVSFHLYTCIHTCRIPTHRTDLDRCRKTVLSSRKARRLCQLRRSATAMCQNRNTTRTCRPDAMG